MSTIAKLTGTVLASSSNWDTWDREFRTLAISKELWDFIDPESDEPFPRRPAKPTAADFHASAPARRSGSASASASTLDEPIYARLTEQERKAFDSAFSHYTHEMRLYEQVAKSIDALKQWVMSTVAQQYRTSACEPTENLK